MCVCVCVCVRERERERERERSLFWAFIRQMFFKRFDLRKIAGGRFNLAEIKNKCYS